MLISNQIWISIVESSLNIGRKKSSRGDYGTKDDALAASHQVDWRYHENYGKPGMQKTSLSVENDDASGLKHEIYSFKNYTVDNTVQLCTHGKIRVKCNYR